jgi:hypothetical protein
MGVVCQDSGGLFKPQGHGWRCFSAQGALQVAEVVSDRLHCHGHAWLFKTQTPHLMMCP